MALEKAYDRVPYEVLWKCSEEKEAFIAHIRVIKNMYEGVKMIVRMSGGDTNNFPFDIELH